MMNENKGAISAPLDRLVIRKEIVWKICFTITPMKA